MQGKFYFEKLSKLLFFCSVFMLKTGRYYLLLGVSFLFCIVSAEEPHFRWSVNKYAPEKYNKLVNTYSFDSENDAASWKDRFTTDSGDWEVTVQRSSQTDLLGTEKYEVVFRLLKGQEKNAAVSVNLDFDSWEKSGYVLFPAAVYNGNRYEFRRIAYSPKLNDVRDIGAQKPIIISDVPRLNINDGPSFIQERSGSMSLPAIGTYHQGNVFFLVTRQANAWGDFGMNFEEKRSGGCEISLMSPLVRERYRYEIADNMKASNDQPADFNEGDEVSFDFFIVKRESVKLQSLFSTFFDIRKDYCKTNQEQVLIYPFSECYSTIEAKFNEQNFVPQWGYYSVGMRENFLQDWQIGWTGGMISTYPLLFSENPQTIQNVLANFDWLFPDGIAPSGFFWDSGEQGDKWYGGDIRRPMTANWHLIRKSGDALYYIMKQFDLMQKRGIAVKPAWHDGTRTVADAFVRLFTEWGQFGQFVDSRTGDVIVGGSTSGAIVPAALTLASRYFDNAEYLSIARLSAEKMYSEYISKGISCGGPGDAMQNPDSESWYAMLESFMVLYDQTKEEKWLQYAIETAEQFSTWVMAYDYKFPTDCLLGRLDMKTTGAVFANTQNKHGAPGICTHSGLALLRLYRATHNPLYLQLLAQITQSIPQYMSHKDRNVGGMPAGWVSERISTTDWLEGIGEIMKGSTWSETALLLSTVELPSVYIDKGNDVAIAFDALNIVRLNEKQLKVTNPTSYESMFKVYVENMREPYMPWEENSMYEIKNIRLKAGESRIIKIK